MLSCVNPVACLICKCGKNEKPQSAFLEAVVPLVRRTSEGFKNYSLNAPNYFY